MNERVDGARRGRGRIQFLLIAAVFFGPLLFAFWLYYGGETLQPSGRTNHGELLEPIENLAERLPESGLHARSNDTWVLLYTNDGSCDEACERALYTIRQSRLMLGRDMERLTRVFLHGDITPDTLRLADGHEGLVTLEDDALAALLSDRIPAGIGEGGYFLIDPLGNLVMYFAPDIEPADMVEDIEHLLKLSRIG